MVTQCWTKSAISELLVVRVNVTNPDAHHSDLASLESTRIVTPTILYARLVIQRRDIEEICIIYFF